MGFTYGELEAAANASKMIDVRDMKNALHALFECSAIGNIQHRLPRRTFFTFKYRNPQSTINYKEQIVLHKGLWKAMNLI